MIKNRNVAPGAAISLSKLEGGGIGLFGAGRILYVCPSTSALYDRWSQNVLAGDLFLTIAEAYAQTITNRNDIIILSPDEHALTSMLDITKNKVHIMGANVVDRYCGQRSRITMGDSTTAADIALIRITGQGCSLTGVKLDSSSTVAASVYALADGGEYTQVTNCEIYKSTDLDQAAAAEVLMNGDSSLYRNCTIGSNVNAITADGARPCVLLTRQTITGKVCRDTTFENCKFWRNAADTDNSFVHSAGATDVERMLLFDGCLFFNTKLAAQTMTVGISAAATLTHGYIVLRNCSSIGVTGIATATGIFISAPLATKDGGECIQAAT